jgi:hypothetical protein
MQRLLEGVFAMILNKRVRNGVLPLAIGAMLLAGASNVSAQEVSELGTFNSWSAWKSADAKGVICYISSDPQDMQPTSVDHGEVHFFIIHRKGLGTRQEVQSLMGYTLKSGSTPTANVDGKSYNMVIEGKAAWLASTGDEAGFVADMKRGKALSLSAESQRGTKTTYTYSLSGVTAAMNAIDKSCS